MWSVLSSAVHPNRKLHSFLIESCIFHSRLFLWNVLAMYDGLEALLSLLTYHVTSKISRVWTWFFFSSHFLRSWNVLTKDSDYQLQRLLYLLRPVTHGVHSVAYVSAYGENKGILEVRKENARKLLQKTAVGEGEREKGKIWNENCLPGIA